MAWLFGASIFLVCWQLISDKTIWPFVLDAPVQAADLAARMVPPDWGFIAKLWRPLWDTLNIATLGTAIGILVAMPVAYCAARNTTPSASLARPLALFIIVSSRSINSLIWALMLVTSLGPGVFAGIIAIGLRSIGFCASFCTKPSRRSTRGQGEAVRATGAAGAQVTAYGTCAGDAGLCRDLGIPMGHQHPESTVLGLVGAGGIGLPLNAAITILAWTQVSLILLVIIATVVLSEWVSARCGMPYDLSRAPIRCTVAGVSPDIAARIKLQPQHNRAARRSSGQKGGRAGAGGQGDHQSNMHRRALHPRHDRGTALLHMRRTCSRWRYPSAAPGMQDCPSLASVAAFSRTTASTWKFSRPVRRIDPGADCRERRHRDRERCAGRLRHLQRGATIRVISSEIIGSPDLYWYVPASSPIRKIEDLNGKTVAYSLVGSSSHAGLLALIAQYKLAAKPTSTGSITATFTQTMTGQVDVGFSGVPFFLDQMEDGKIRIVASGNDVDSLKSRSGRVNITNVATLQNRREALARFHAAYKETLDWMYADPAALKIFSEFTGLPERVVSKVRELVPKAALAPDRIVGVDQIIAESVSEKFLAAPLTSQQVSELVNPTAAR